MSLPDSLGAELLAAFMGDADVEASSSQVFDAVGELTNMACGDWLTHVSGHRRFDLAPPVVQRMAPGWRPTTPAAGPVDQLHQALFSVAGTPITLDVAFQVN